MRGSNSPFRLTGTARRRWRFQSVNYSVSIPQVFLSDPYSFRGSVLRYVKAALYPELRDRGVQQRNRTASREICSHRSPPDGPDDAKGSIRTIIAQIFSLPLYRWSYLGQEPPAGIEPATFSLGPRRSSDRAATVQCARLDSNQQLPI